MMARTHMAFGFLAGLIFLPIIQPKSTALFLTITTVASILADVDHEKSRINKLFPLTRWVPKFFKHRGFFHSAFPPIMIYAGLHYARLDYIGIPMTIGYLSHLASDCLTQMGCNFLHPISTLRVQGFIHTDGTMELATLGIVLFLNALLVAKLFF